VPHLSEVSGVAEGGGSSDVFFAAGRAMGPWELAVTGAASSKPADAGAQENARVVTWSGGEGSFLVRGPAVDLQRQATGDMAVMVRYRIDAAPTGPVTLGIGCADDASCAGTIDVTSAVKEAPLDAWQSVKIKLSCFQAAGAKMDHVTAPFVVRASGPFSLSLTEVRLASNEGDAICPQ
jgi:beta-glucosidase